MAKRLRGWQMERESGISKTARPSKALGKADGFGKGQDSDGFGKGQESVLGNKLLFLWARGQLSAALVRELADCAIADGAQHSDLGIGERSQGMSTGK